MSKITSNEPFGNMPFVQRRLDELFNKGIKLPIESNLSQPAPAEIFIEDDKRLIAEIDIEGFSQDELTVKIQGNILEIMAYKVPAIKKANENSAADKFPERNFYRQVILPVKNTKSRFSANFNKGKLRIVVPLSKEPPGNTGRIKTP